MKKYSFIIVFVTTAAIGGLLQPFTPWWTIAVWTAVLGILIDQKAYVHFWAAFAGAALLWGAWAFVLSQENEGILAERIGELFGGIGGYAVLVATALIGGLTAGLGAVTGSLGRKAFYDTSKRF